MIEEPGRSVCWPLRALSPALFQKLDSSLLLEFGTECSFLGWRERELRLLGFLAVCEQELPEALQFRVLLRGSCGVDQLVNDAFHVRGRTCSLSRSHCALLRSLCPWSGTLIPGCFGASAYLRLDPEPPKLQRFACPAIRLTGPTSADSGKLTMLCCHESTRNRHKRDHTHVWFQMATVPRANWSFGFASSCLQGQRSASGGTCHFDAHPIKTS